MLRTIEYKTDWLDAAKPNMYLTDWQDAANLTSTIVEKPCKHQLCLAVA